MRNALFLQSSVADPYALYADMRAKSPIHFDEENGIWTVCTHAHCKRVLESAPAHIPGQDAALLSLMNASSTTLVEDFARLANPPRHAVRRDAVMRLFQCMRSVDAGQLLPELIAQAGECDWIADVARRLPVLAVMRAFDFDDADIGTVLCRIERLTKIMLPNKTAAQIDDVNAVADDILALAARHLAHRFPALAGTAEASRLHASNLVGLMVQSVDAGRGILSNTLLQAVCLPQRPEGEGWQKLVVETLRFDPPIQNTRRMLGEAMALGGAMLPKGAAVLVVLASANRDEEVFAHAACFDPERGNNDAHLTFGAGTHGCPAHRFATRLAAQALRAFFREGRRVELLQEDITYEPMVNARLPREIRLRYSS